MRKPAIALLPLLFIAAAQAAPAKPDCDLALDADTVEANVLSGKGGTASGNVVVTRCDMKLRADTVRLFMANGQYERIVTNGKVLLISDKSGLVISGDTGVYEVARQFVTVTGKVVLKDGRNVASGTRLTYNVATGQAHMGAQPEVAAAPGAPGSGNGRVHAILGSPAKSGTNP